MARRTSSNPESMQALNFPLAGLDESAGFGRQRKNTCADAKNVRAFEPSTGRARGGVRPGIAKYASTQLASGASLQDIASVVYTATGSTMTSGRQIKLLVVAGGKLYSVASGVATLIDAAFLSASQEVVYSDSNLQVLYYVDGTQYKKYTPSTNTAAAWAATAGTMPASGSDRARLITTWRGRTVLSGLLGDGHNWFMSALGDALNWDYSPATTVETQAVAGNSSAAGKVGDIVTCLVPYSDDVLILLCDHSTWQMSGDPMAGGRIDCLSDRIGGAWGRPFCRDPYGNLYFMSNHTGVYQLQPGEAPQRISQPIEQRLEKINTGTSFVRMVWDDGMQGIHVFITPTSAAAATTHYFWEARTSAWWPDVFADKNFDPKCCLGFDGDSPNDRSTLIGSWDGYLRVVRQDLTTDDGQAISSSVVLGPLASQDLQEILLKTTQATMGETSGSVTWSVLVGKTAEQALASTPVLSGTWGAGRNVADSVWRAGHAVYVKISATSPWAMETVVCRLQSLGKVRQRA